uniref:Protein kinase domain-containing protein n=1 Tax=viral metagenome TaxID=1070528 RepID=A0A6C0LWR3_9ZZZZ
MGNNSSNSCELQEYSDVCQMAACLDNSNGDINPDTIMGLKADSASPTDTWIVKFKDTTTYDRIPIQQAFLKIWVSNYSYKCLDEHVIQFAPNNPRNKSIFDTYKNKNKALNSGLNYEARVYRDIVKPMIEKNICPNFVKFLGLGKDCSVDSLIRMLNVGDPHPVSNFRNLYGNTVSMMTTVIGGPKRNKITDGYSREELSTRNDIISPENLKKHITYNIIANEVIKPNTLKLWEFVHQTDAFGYQGRDDDPNPVYWNVIFQILASCYAMSQTKMNHNDLHLGNVYIEPVDDSGGSRRFNYNYGNTLFTFESQYIAKVYDFDRGYVTRFGDNPLLGQRECERYSQCNSIIPNLDAIKLMGGLYKKKGTAETILNACTTNNQKKKTLLRKIFNDSNFLRLNGQRVGSAVLSGFNSVLEIMTNIATLSNIENVYPIGYIPDPQDVFTCNPSMFNEVGKILEIVSKTPNVENEKNKTTQKTRIKNLPCPPKEVRDKETGECRPDMRIRGKGVPRKPKTNPPCPPKEVRDRKTGECRPDKRRKNV